MLSMKKERWIWIPLVLFLLCGTSGHSIFAQDWAKPLIKNLHRVDLRDLGYPLGA